MEWYLTLLAVYRNKKEVLFNIINREGLKTNSCSSNQTSRGSVRSLRLTETKSSTQVAEKKKKTRDASADPGFVSMGKTNKNGTKIMKTKTCQVI